MASQPSPSPLKLTPEIKALVNDSLTSGNPMVLAAVDANRRPLLSFRGSAAVHSDDQIGLWIRNNQGGTIEAIKGNPQVAMMYRSATVPMLQFQGRARIVADTAQRNRVFEAAPERERNSDPERKGTAIVIDLDSVSGVLKFDQSGAVFVQMAR